MAWQAASREPTSFYPGTARLNTTWIHPQEPEGIKTPPRRGSFFPPLQTGKGGAGSRTEKQPVEMPLDTRMVFCILVYIVNLYTKEVLYGDHFFPDFCRVG